MWAEFTKDDVADNNATLQFCTEALTIQAPVEHISDRWACQLCSCRCSHCMMPRQCDNLNFAICMHDWALQPEYQMGNRPVQAAHSCPWLPPVSVRQGYHAIVDTPPFSWFYVMFVPILNNCHCWLSSCLCKNSGVSWSSDCAESSEDWVQARALCYCYQDYGFLLVGLEGSLNGHWQPA